VETVKPKPPTPVVASTTPPLKPVSKNLQEALAQTIKAINDYAKNISQKDLEKTLIDYLKQLQTIIAGVPGPIVTTGPVVHLDGDQVTITWSTDKPSGSQVAISPASDYNPKQPDVYYQVVGNPDHLETSHSVTIYALEASTTYHYQLRNRSSLGVTFNSRDYQFKTEAAAPEITNYSSEVVSPDHAIFRWLTSVEADSRIRIIPYLNGTLVFDQATIIKDAKQSLIHQLEAINLERGTMYQIELSGVTRDGQTMTKIIDGFKTVDDNQPPKIDNIKADIAIIPGKQERTQTIFTWITDKSATSKVYYKLGAGVFDIKDSEAPITDEAYTRRHAIILTKLQTGGIYSFRVESLDTAGRSTLSDVHTIFVPKQAESVFDMIIHTFEQMFGWMGNINGTKY
jgi:hypothetical protein